MLSSGALPQRVTIHLLTEQPDGHDGVVDVWTPVHRRVPARIRPLAGRDLERARAIDPRITHDVTFRYWQNYRTDLAGGRSKIVYHDIVDREFEIVGPPVDTNEAHVELVQTCKEAA